jgi:histidinol phosphatase-like enzyme (inositol monophosphatase family)
MSTSDAPIADRLQAAVEFAQEAGRLTLQYFARPIAVERKSDDSPVTIADRQAEQLLRQRIAEAFPDDGIIGEEFGEQPGTSPYSWVLDPIDGTKSFICGVPLFGTMVGMLEEDRPVLGVVYFPGSDEGIYARLGGGAWHFRGDDQPRAAHVAANSALRDGAFVTSQVDCFDARGAAEVYAKLQQAAYITRTWGDCYGYLLVATGRALVMVDPVMNVWDAAAVAPIIEEAGGAFTDWRGDHTIHSQEAIGAAPGVLEEVLAITRPFAK